MAFRTLAGRVGRGAATVGSATAGAVIVSPGQALARAPPTPVTPQRASDTQDVHNHPKMLGDDWLLPQVEKDDVLFSCEHIDEAAADLKHLSFNSLGQALPFNDDVSSDESDGAHANDVIELAEETAVHTRQFNTININPQNLNALVDVATELLKKSTVQKEIISAISNHPQLVHHVLESAGLDNGFHPALGAPTTPWNPLLIEAPPSGKDDNGRAESNEDVWANIVAQISNAFTTVGQNVNAAFGQIGLWLRAVLHGTKVEEVGKAEGGEASESGEEAKAASSIMKYTVLVALVIVCLMVARRPQVAVRLAKVLTKKAAGV